MEPLDEETDIRCHKDTPLTRGSTKPYRQSFMKGYQHSKGPLPFMGADPMSFL
jgi:hypothetical protein